MLRTFWLILFALSIVPTVGFARDVYVNNQIGDDRATGRYEQPRFGGEGPVSSLGRALSIANRGDRIVMADTGVPYREGVTLQAGRNSGEPDRPFVIEGNGATLDGSEPVPPDAWEFWRGEVFRFQPRRFSHQQLFLDDRPLARRTLDANAMRDGVHIRLTLSRGEKYTSGLDPRINTNGHTLIIAAEHKPPVYDKSGITLKTAVHRRPPSDVLDQTIHSCNQLTSILAKLEANAAGADDALMLDTRGFVAETNATHLFFVFDGVVHTPTTAACPEGITRAVVIELCERHEIDCTVRDITLAETYWADEAFCTGTMGELAPVVSIDGRPIGTGKAGPVTTRLTELFRELTRHEGERVVD